MRWSKAYIPTLKEDPAEAEVISHKLMLRAGMMKKVGSGIYTLLPLGLIVARTIERIVREEMNRAGAQELLMPILSPAELWRETGRWDVYGDELMRLKDRHTRDFVLGPTHEEVITDLVRGKLRSYRQLPLTLYQIQTKFRDEIRPRFGLMRGREFIMKDAYSFNRDEKCLDNTYWDMHGAYDAVFRRCGLRFRPVLADPGAIGGDFSHEFMVLANTGESLVISCPSDECAYAATDETAESVIEDAVSGSEPDDVREVHTPNMKTVEEVCSFLKAESHNLVKTILYETDGEVVGALIRGDREICEPKLRRALRTDTLTMADAGTVEGSGDPPANGCCTGTSGGGLPPPRSHGDPDGDPARSGELSPSFRQDDRSVHCLAEGSAREDGGAACGARARRPRGYVEPARCRDLRPAPTEAHLR